MEEELQQIINSGGLYAFFIMIGSLLKYVLTIIFLITGSIAFNKYINKNKAG